MVRLNRKISTWQQRHRHVVLIFGDNGQPQFAALGGTLAGEVVEVLERREAAHSAELIKLWRGNPKILCLVALKDVCRGGPLRDTGRGCVEQTYKYSLQQIRPPTETAVIRRNAV